MRLIDRKILNIITYEVNIMKVSAPALTKRTTALKVVTVGAIAQVESSDRSSWRSSGRRIAVILASTIR
jgi:hypothetical protein